jgi:hypothetical protein
VLDVHAINELHRETVRRWHEQPVENNYSGILHAVCEQHARNFLLWHEEDIARSRDVSDARIAEVKRAIDGYNQQRNDWIEQLDGLLLAQLTERNIRPAADCPLGTETPGSAVDRLSIMSLRIYHMQEQLDRDDATDAHRASVRQKLATCYEQHDDLSGALSLLLEDIFAGRKRLKLYRQMKMYNDPALNPYLYKSPSRKAG